tara:strand:+ start:350 stop:682 length:333 start_codon:yes stop_codon:yes gene_type:complete
MIQINKELTRPDKGVVASGSLLDYTTQFIGESKIVRFNLTHWFNLDVKNEPQKDGWLPISGVKDFMYIQRKECTPEEWGSLNDAGSAVMVEDWLQEIIESKIGNGTTEII